MSRRDRARSFLVNGTDYLVIGLIATATGPVAYIIFKLLYGGLAKNDPVGNPLNGKTKLAAGDTVRIGIYLVCAGSMAFFGTFWLRWYEIENGEWGPDDYDTMGNIIPQVQNVLQWVGLAVLIIGIILVIMGNRFDRPIKEEKLDIDKLMEKYHE